MTPLQVDCRQDGEGWSCSVTVGDDAGATTHEVRVAPDALERLAPGAVEPTALVRASFEFLLEREAPESILRSFELPVIGRYFPEYEQRIRMRLAQA
jgi:hypothetical protein